MKPWVEDILDQLALAHLLAHADISCGERLAMIIVDNAVEYACKAYVEVHKRLISKVVKKKDWEAIKGSFPQLVDFIAQQEPQLKAHVSTIIGFHSIRNDLYHGGNPLSVKVSTVDEYSKLARSVLDVLLGVQEDEKEQAKRITAIHTALLGEAKKEVKAGVTFESVNDVVRFSTLAKVKLPDAICLAIHGYAREKGQAPTVAQVEESLSRSGHTSTKKIISVRLSELRGKGFVRKDNLTLTDRGRAKLLKAYL